MRKNRFIKMSLIMILWLAGINTWAQTIDSVWTLSKCIEYAMQKNISIQEKVLKNETNRVNVEQAKASRFP
jgi:hypothetical protein